MSTVLDLLKSHRSIRKFTEQAIDSDLLNDLVLAGQAAATSSFLQGSTIIRITDKATRAEIAKLAGNQKYVETAAEFFMFCADLKRAGNYCEAYEKPFEGDFTEHFIIATTDVALMAQSLVTAAESVGLGICYIGGIRNNPAEVSRILQLPKGVYPVFGLCLGYPDQDPEVKPRLPVSVIMKQEVYNEEGDKDSIAIYDEKIREYYKTRTGGGHGISWSEQVASLLSEKSRPHMREFLEQQGFKFK
ncbi:MAG: oxygen-insensitive NADPH nitroreductase [Gammaproteobacteria bacterium]|jgi:nitroreductase|nr:oxygen-insensitive NADPH nitroreductase [Gammaproteobacteria bacterium]MBT3859624.1 oxygen-insensitive NADPH nitroreductase [Gammaproteobacteria bacterium]MBT3986482.1 oxygen-insensitive NADPH nitroreductase [Gammaproteobacteria bacterium]MBT4256781.1 oxygen-insensitive NADPH nitroreductase [Gammaproteobacteria bacterium]MBT4582169.1 oxygen-insensitive NADPH nitroreductase [Gammaproteobacteria bacterium]